MSDELWRQYADTIAANAELGTLVMDLRADTERLRGLLRRLRVESLHHKGCACSLCKEIDAALAGTAVQPQSEPQGASRNE